MRPKGEIQERGRKRHYGAKERLRRNSMLIAGVLHDELDASLRWHDKEKDSNHN